MYQELMDIKSNQQEIFFSRGFSCLLDTETSQYATSMFCKLYLVFKTSLLRTANFKHKAKSNPRIFPILDDVILVPEIDILFAGFWRGIYHIAI